MPVPSLELSKRFYATETVAEAVKDEVVMIPLTGIDSLVSASISGYLRAHHDS